ncbi:CubicO group peptidase (beta-lactamase class C family) [Nonomuraea thailandensis]|uniref:CubicO group peptidase (Beta-lactamase class C family) n=1 Tax=Nonomuraea thailandensis TaxID=1188745 RepID=A0A9X2GID8_9ACTN|nr:beta-lactamase family protein [Nonomuraea thailandensis]MCP2358380.1 CubicO group peptidase (beta-lactamase class C family) [Nonomuraea thailandensis]
MDDYLPEFGMDRRITVRMLLQHTSGVFNFTGEYVEDGTLVPGMPATPAGKGRVDNRFHDGEPGRGIVGFLLARDAAVYLFFR